MGYDRLKDSVMQGQLARIPTGRAPDQRDLRTVSSAISTAVHDASATSRTGELPENRTQNEHTARGLMAEAGGAQDGITSEQLIKNLERQRENPAEPRKVAIDRLIASLKRQEGK